MFAKRQPAFAGSAAVARRAPQARDRTPRLGKAQIAAAAAAGLVLAAAGALVLAVGPGGGAPSVRVALTRPKPPPPKPLSPDAGAQAFALDSLGLSQSNLAADASDSADSNAPPIEGAATITLPDSVEAPDGASVARGAPAAAAALPQRPPAAPLPAAPIPGLSQATAMGPLPVISPDGRTPFQAYARPFKPDGRPRVALIVGGLGLNPSATRAAILQLPAEVTLSFVPYAQNLQSWIDLARANGHEVLLEIPMEPQDYPDNDPGPQTLLADAPGAQTVKKLDWLLSRATGYFGVSNYLGQKFIASDNGMGAFLGELKARGLAFLDDGSARRRAGAGAPRASADAIVDDQLSADAIARQLAGLEQTAKTRGSALGSGFAYPVTVETAARWAAGLSARGLQLAPASALARR